MTTKIRTSLLQLLACLCLVGHAQAQDITVGLGGTAADCSRATLKEALALAKSLPGPNTIWVSRNTPLGYETPGTALEITDDDVEIVGGFSDCMDHTPDELRTDISGEYRVGPRDPVFRIRGTSNVVLRNLGIVGGDADSGEAGGIDFRARGTLTVIDSLIEYNHNDSAGNNARTAGGIRVQGLSGGGAVFTMQNSIVRFNTATTNSTVLSLNAGGIALVDFVDAFIENNSQIANNQGWYGGGIYVDESAELYASASGRELLIGNTAHYGGALAVAPLGYADFRSRTTAGVMRNNVAVSQGCAIYNLGRTILYAMPGGEMNLVGNSCHSGTPMGSIVASSGELHMANTNFFPTNPTDPRAADAVIEAIGGEVTWNERYDLIIAPEAHFAGDPDKITSLNTRSVIKKFDTARVSISRVDISNNTGDQLLEITTPSNSPANSFIKHSLFTDNTLARGIINNAAGVQSGAFFNGVTVARNTIGLGQSLFKLQGGFLSMTNSIVDQPGRAFGIEDSSSAFNNISTAFNLPSGVIFATPIYSAFPYLAVNSPGIDQWNTNDADAYGNSRREDQCQVRNRSGPSDLGAVETPALSLFCNGFE